MQQKKLVRLQRLLQNHKIADFRGVVVHKVKNLVPVIRACYDSFLPDDNVSMAWVFAIDGLFLLHLFQLTNTDSDQIPKVDSTKRLLAQDIMMVENQIPFMLLKEINEALHSSSPGSNDFSPSIYRSFSEIHSPLKLCPLSKAPTNHVHHLLHYMYHSIINNVPTPTFDSVHLPVPGRMTKILLPGIVNFVEQLPTDEIVRLYELAITSLHNFSSIGSGTTIPSASRLQSRAGFQFHSLPENGGGVESVYVNGNTIYLPPVTLESDSDVILRNLVAYETLMPHSDHHPLAEYASLMCGLIVDVEDVRVLKQHDIIRGELGEDEVAEIFVGMSGSILSSKIKSKSALQNMIVEVNKVYEGRPRIMAYLFLKKLAKWVLVFLTHIGSVVGGTWKIVAFVAGLVSLVMLTYKNYCDVYGCDKKN
ncbi:hypothetical protein SSX86_032179 [Deinandra increscens subsp. villosa]|uniref:Uncharacterized protein n=1 Tax=Deinandra increscens subsp. villosa TaxID=3103831 RepID=A0AAP0GI05_9ASTR